MNTTTSPGRVAAPKRAPVDRSPHADGGATPALHVLLVDDHDMVREALRHVLSSHAGIQVVADVASVAAASRVLAQQHVDVVVLDIHLEDEDGLALADLARQRPSPPKVLVLTADRSSNTLARTLRRGVEGYLLKAGSGEELVRSVRRVAAGQQVLDERLLGMVLTQLRDGGLAAPTGAAGSGRVTPREQEVLNLLAEGHNAAGIGQALGISPRTVQKHIQNLLRKFEVHDRASLVHACYRLGLLQ